MSSPTWQMTQKVGSPGGFKTNAEYDAAWDGLHKLNEQLYGEKNTYGGRGPAGNRLPDAPQQQPGSQQPQPKTPAPTGDSLDMSAYRPANTAFADAWNSRRPADTKGVRFTPATSAVGTGPGNLAYAPADQRPPGFEMRAYDLQGNPTSLQGQQNQRDAFISQIMQAPRNTPSYDFQGMMNNANGMVRDGWTNPFTQMIGGNAPQPDRRRAVSDLFASSGIQAPPGFMDQLLGLLGQQAAPQQLGPPPSAAGSGGFGGGYEAPQMVGRPDQIGAPTPADYGVDWRAPARKPGSARPVPPPGPGTPYDPTQVAEQMPAVPAQSGGGRVAALREEAGRRWDASPDEQRAYSREEAMDRAASLEQSTARSRFMSKHGMPARKKVGITDPNDRFVGESNDRWIDTYKVGPDGEWVPLTPDELAAAESRAMDNIRESRGDAAKMRGQYGLATSRDREADSLYYGRNRQQVYGRTWDQLAASTDPRDQKLALEYRKRAANAPEQARLWDQDRNGVLSMGADDLLWSLGKGADSITFGDFDASAASDDGTQSYIDLRGGGLSYKDSNEDYLQKFAERLPPGWGFRRARSRSQRFDKPSLVLTHPAGASWEQVQSIFGDELEVDPKHSARFAKEFGIVQKKAPRERQVMPHAPSAPASPGGARPPSGGGVRSAEFRDTNGNGMDDRDEPAFQPPGSARPVAPPSSGTPYNPGAPSRGLPEPPTRMPSPGQQQRPKKQLQSFTRDQLATPQPAPAAGPGPRPPQNKAAVEAAIRADREAQEQSRLRDAAARSERTSHEDAIRAAKTSGGQAQAIPPRSQGEAYKPMNQTKPVVPSEQRQSLMDAARKSLDAAVKKAVRTGDDSALTEAIDALPNFGTFFGSSVSADMARRARDNVWLSMFPAGKADAKNPLFVKYDGLKSPGAVAQQHSLRKAAEGWAATQPSRDARAFNNRKMDW